MEQDKEPIGVIGWASRVLVTMAVVATAWTVHGARAADGLKIRRSRATGLASFVTQGGGGSIPVQARARSAKAAPMDFLRQYGHLFGATAAERQLVLAGVDTDSLGQTHTTYRQVHRGVPVFGGMLKVHQAADGQFFAANGDFFPVPAKLSLVPAIEAATARRLALATVPSRSPTVERFELVVVDPGWYGDSPRGARLAYHVVLADPLVPLREAFFIDAHTGATLDRWSLIHQGRIRSIHDTLAGSDCCYGRGVPGCDDAICQGVVCGYLDFTCCTVSWDNYCAYLAANYCEVCALPGPLARGEGGAVAGVADVDIAYDYYGDIYDYYWRAFAHDSIDNAGMMIIATVNSYAPYCPNAFWNGSQMVFCTGTVTDDIAGHELTHGVTQFSASLMYQNQCGQLNESFSDVFGELIDLFNGDAAFAGPPGGTPSWPAHPTGPGVDEPNNLRTTCSTYDDGYQDGVRWLLGEDSYAFGGAIRDMWDPTCFGDPDRANSELQICSVYDHGGVHGGSGTPSHAFAIATDGKDFNGYSVTGIGPIKTGAVWYRALTTYLTPTADFEDAYAAFNQAALDLVDTAPPDPRTGGPSDSIFTADDAAQVDQALRAVEMDTPGRCGRTIPVLDPSAPTECTPRTTIFFDDFESGAPGWTVSNEGAYGGPPPTPYDWMLTTGPLPFDRPGTAWFCEDRDIGDCYMQDESAVHHLDSPLITLPSELTFPVLKLTHFVETERGWDGGNVKIRVNGAPWQVIPPSAFYHNRYNAMHLNTPEQGSTDPLAGEPGFTGFGGGWGWSAVYLAGLVSGGDNVQFRFDFGKDGCTGYTGWYMDLFEIYDCAASPDCNGNGLPDEEEMAGGARWEMILQQPPTFGGGTFSDKGAQVPGEPVVAAEDFYLAHATTLTSIKIWGGYLPDAVEPPNVFSVLVHADDGGLPGDVKGFEFDVPSTQVQTGQIVFGTAVWEITLTFTNPIPLDAGGYFVEIFNDTTAVDSDFLWASSEYLGTPGFAVALEVPGTTWYDGGGFDLAIDVYGGMIGVDCNANGTPDDCEPDEDCNVNGVQDICDIAAATSSDCNENVVPDECDLAEGTSADVNANGVPDECDECVTDGDCDDGQFCTGVETCVDGVCQSPGDPCNPLICDEGLDECLGGACCQADMTCTHVLPEECRDAGQTFFDGQGCTEVVCPVVTGACCVDGLCAPDEQQAHCLSVANAGWAGPGTVCFEGLCPLCDDGDSDGDGDVDLYDFAWFQNCFDAAGTGECQCLDMDNNNVVDLSDYARFEPVFMGATELCGNGVIDPGEQCDDGNTTGGDGCDENCLLEGGTPPNDLCADPTAVTDGTVPFSNEGATTDSITETGACANFVDLVADVWFCYEATCSGTATASLCGSSYDTTVSVYAGCECPSNASALACNDDGCGVSIDFRSSRTTFPATAGNSYLIRVAGYDNSDPASWDAEGTGKLTIFCGNDTGHGADACGSGSPDCFTVDESPGCADEVCCLQVCIIDPYCCDVEWDGICTEEAVGVCGAGFATCGAGAGDCFTGDDTRPPGCSLASCCQAVCEQDPVCCVSLGFWDQVCAEEAVDLCDVTDVCAEATGSCFAEHADPGCSNQECCELVCLDDPYCCDPANGWDELCVERAVAECRE